MSNGTGPDCDLACQTKIIIDGDLTGQIFATTCEAIERFLDHGGTLQHSDKVMEKLIAAEDAAYEFQRALL